MAQGFTRNGSSVITITGNSGGPLSGSGFTFTGGTTGLTFAGAGTTQTLGGTLAVVNGGTGLSSTTANQLLYSSGTSVIAGLTNGTTGQVLTATTGSAPAFANPISVNSFMAYKTSAATNVTGDATDYTIVFDTENYDLSNQYNNSTGTWTVGTTGYYHFGFTILLTGLLAAHSFGEVYFAYTGTYSGNNNQYLTNIGAIRSGPGGSANTASMSISVSLLLTAADTVIPHVIVSNSTKVVGVAGSFTQCYFWAQRIY